MSMDSENLRRAAHFVASDTTNQDLRNGVSSNMSRTIEKSPYPLNHLG